MPGGLVWGYYPTTKVWLPIQVDSVGRIKADMSNINLGDLANVDLTGLADDDFLYYDDATKLWKPRKLVDADIPAAIARDSEVTAAIATHAAIASAHHTKYTDAEALAYIQAQLRQIYNGATLLIDLTDDGILTTPKQSFCAVSMSADQTIPTDQYIRVVFDTETTDIQSEFDNYALTDQAEAGTDADTLVCAGVLGDVAVGDWIWNKTDNTYHIVTDISGAPNSVEYSDVGAGELADGDDFEIYRCTFTATVAGVYLVATQIMMYGMSDGAHMYIGNTKNGAYFMNPATSLGGAGLGTVMGLGMVSLAANDVLGFRAKYDTSDATENIYGGAAYRTNVFVAKIA